MRIVRNAGILILLSLSFSTGFSIPQNDVATDQYLKSLLDSNNLFKLREELKTSAGKLSEDRLLYYHAMCSNAFGNCEESIQNIDSLLNRFGNGLADAVLADLLTSKATCYIRQYRYGDAATVYKQLVSKYGSRLDNLDEYVNIQQLLSTLANVKPQQIRKHGDVEISGYQHPLGHLLVPVKCEGLEERFIFDTGANFSSITQSYAKKMNMTIYDANVHMGSVANSKVKTTIAVADSIYLGDLLFENVVFLVVSDESMTFPSINLEVSGIIGFPVIYQMEEVRIRKDGSIFIPQEAKQSAVSNMYLRYLSPVIQVISGSDSLIFKFDTGASQTCLSKQYLSSREKVIEKISKSETVRQDGAGSVVDIDVYDVKNFHFTIGSKSKTLDEIIIYKEDMDFLYGFDGNLGQDVIGLFDEMILNFKYMYLDFSIDGNN